MRTEVKFAIVVVLVAVIGAGMYFFSRGNEKPIDLTSPKPLKQTVTSKDEMPLPLGPGGQDVAVRTVEPSPSPTVQPEPTNSPEVVVKEDEPAKPSEPQKKTVLTIDLNPLSGNGPATRPAKPTERRSSKAGHESAAKEDVVPNQPAKVDLAMTSEETKPEVGSASPASATPSVHVVKPSETLYSIAKQYYGRGEMWTVIARANKELHPTKLYTGMKLTIPASDKATAHFDGVDTKNGKNTKNVKEQAAKAELPSKVDKSKLKTYKVKAGDSFYTIAKETLGAGTRWKEVYELNKGKIGKPENIRAGQTIYVPAK